MITCPDFSQCRIVVIGDAMLDSYWHGDTSRISPEAPVPVVKIERDEARVGGAANVAVNVQALGAQATTLISQIAADDAGRTLAQLLAEKEIQCQFIQTPNTRTTLKLRVIGRHQQLIRLDFEDKSAIPPNQVLAQLQSVIDNCDILIISDYAKGMISDPQALIAVARAHNVRVLVDPKNMDLSVYKGATVLTPNLGEFEAMVGRCENSAQIEQKGAALLTKLDIEALLVTRGSQGMTLIQKNVPAVHIPAQAREVFDITGAGDTVIAVLGASLAAGLSVLQAAKLANLAAGLAVGRLGTAMVTREELQQLACDQKMLPPGIMSLANLFPEIARRKANGNKVVMTNGCFDILHAGHVTYLQQASALGDCLIVAVNDDDSVARLKGPTRPINSLAHRMQILAAMRCVDYVIPFSEDTPEDLIVKITPDILVKGGDYTVPQIAGASHVLQHGGKVEILSFVEGLSTTKTLEKMRDEEMA